MSNSQTASADRNHTAPADHQDTPVFYTCEIGPIVYVDEPEQVGDAFQRNPETGFVVTQTKMPLEVLKELPNIQRLSQRHSSSHAFRLACRNTWLSAWIEEMTQGLGDAYPLAEIYRNDDVATKWHIDMMRGRRRAFIQIDGERFKMAAPASPMKLDFDAVNSAATNAVIYSPAGKTQDEVLAERGVPVATLRPGQMAVFGDRGLHFWGEGIKCAAISY